MAGAQLRKGSLASTDSMLFFAVRRRSAVDEATGPRSHGKKGPVALWSPKPVLRYCFSPRLRRFGLGSYTYRQHGKRSAPLLNLRQDQTRFWLHTSLWQFVIAESCIGVNVSRLLTRTQTPKGQHIARRQQ